MGITKFSFRGKKSGFILATAIFSLIFILGMIFQVTDGGVVYAEDEEEIIRRGEIVQFSGDVHVSREEVVEGDVVAFSGNIAVDGSVEGDVVAFAGDIYITGTVNGDAVSMGGNVNVAPSGSLDGEIVSLGAGGIKEGLSAVGANLPFFSGFAILGGVFSLVLRIFSLVVFLAIALALIYFLGEYIENMSDHIEANIGRVLLFGLGGLILLPVAVLALAVTIIGIPIIPFIILGIFAVAFYGYVAVAVYVGKYILSLFKFKVKSPWRMMVELAAGYVIIWLVQQLPLLGSLVYAVLVIVALGLVIDSKFGTLRPWFRK